MIQHDDLRLIKDSRPNRSQPRGYVPNARGLDLNGRCSQGEIVLILFNGNLFESNAQTLVNAVNCVGVMGKGIALEFKRRFPEMFADYEVRCSERRVKLGQPYLHRYSRPPWILNFPTKDHWRSASRLKDIVHGLEYLAQKYKEWRIESLAVPALGCGLGQLDWAAVKPVLCRHLELLDIPVELYVPIVDAGLCDPPEE